MTNRITRPRTFAWKIGPSALLMMGRLAAEREKRRRDAEAAAEKEGSRVERPYSPSKAEREGQRSKVWR